MAIIMQHDIAPPGLDDDFRDEAALTIDYPSEPELNGRARRYSAPETSGQVAYQRCGGGRRVIKKRIGD